MIAKHPEGPVESPADRGSHECVIQRASRYTFLTASSILVGSTSALEWTDFQTAVGWSWGSRMLTLLDGSQHQFKVSGLDVVAVGIKQATGVGNVYHLKRLADFEGKYVKAAAGVAVGGGAGATTMQNDKGVVINLTGVGQGMDFRLAVSEIDVALIK